MAFPTSPSNNQVHKEGNRAFVYDSALGVWDQVAQQENQFHSRKNDQINLQSFREPPRMPEGSVIQVQSFNGLSNYKIGSTSSLHTIASGTGSTYFLSSGQMDAGTKASTGSMTIRQDGSKVHMIFTSHPYLASGVVSGAFGRHDISFAYNLTSAGDEDRWKDQIFSYFYVDARSTNGAHGQESLNMTAQGFLGNGIKFRKGDVVYFGARINRLNTAAERGCSMTVQEIAG